MIFFRKISKGHISAKKEKQVELRFLFSARCLVMFYICTKFHENIFDGGVTVLVLYTSAADGLYLYQVS